MISIDSPTFNFFFSLFYHLHCYTIKSISINVFNAAKIQKRLNSTVSIDICYLSLKCSILFRGNRPKIFSLSLFQIYIYIHIPSKIISVTNFLLPFLWPLEKSEVGNSCRCHTYVTQRIETRRRESIDKSIRVASRHVTGPCPIPICQPIHSLYSLYSRVNNNDQWMQNLVPRRTVEQLSTTGVSRCVARARVITRSGEERGG